MRLFLTFYLSGRRIAQEMDSRLRGSTTLTFQRPGSGMMLVEMLAYNLQILAVRAPEKVEDIASERNGAECGINTDIGRHAGQLQFGHAQIARFPDNIGAHQCRCYITNHRDQPDN